jgi:uncharacterized membrane protein (DUF4010 family)
MEILERLGVSLMIGLLIGVERGWHDRSAERGSRPAGVRTFGMIGILGGLWGLLANELGNMILGFAFVGFAILIATAHAVSAAATRSHGVTTMVAALATFALGAMAVRGFMVPAAAAAVMIAILLGLKPILNTWVEHLKPEELYSSLKLLLISVVLLPVLPNRTIDPWNVLNPFEIWWMVVLIASISFIGYFAIKMVGPRHGIGLTGVFGGLASSTALTFHFARLARNSDGAHRLFAAGVVIAAATMFPRLLVIVGVIHPPLLSKLALPFLLMSVIGYAGAALLWSQSRKHTPPAGPIFKNPVELRKAIAFGALLAVIMILAKLSRLWMGDAGLFMLSGISGLGETDAITLSLARMARADLSAEVVAAKALLIVGVVNTLLKGGIVAIIAGNGMSKLVNGVFALIAAVGIVWLIVA